MRQATDAAHGYAHCEKFVPRRCISTEAASKILLAQLPLISGCIREGFDVPDKLLLFWHLRRYPDLHPRALTHDPLILRVHPGPNPQVRT